MATGMFCFRYRVWIGVKLTPFIFDYMFWRGVANPQSGELHDYNDQIYDL